jgi:hypothetical protein
MYTLRIGCRKTEASRAAAAAGGGWHMRCGADAGLVLLHPRRRIPMYYDDQTRQFNYASGLALGALVGVGLALLLAPRRREPEPLLPDAVALGARARQRLALLGTAAGDAARQAMGRSA